VVSNCFTAFGELLALNKRFAELSGGVTRYCLKPAFSNPTHAAGCMQLLGNVEINTI